jgi:hypothetical protein
MGVVTESSLRDNTFTQTTGPGEFEMQALYPGHKLAQLIVIGNLVYQILAVAHPDTHESDWEVDANYCGKDRVKVTIGRREP